MKREDFIKYKNDNKITYTKMASMMGLNYLTFYKWVSGQTGTVTEPTLQKIRAFYNEYINETKTRTPMKIVKRKDAKTTIYDFEELLEELNNGHEVFINGTDAKLKMVNGFVVRYSGDNVVSINPAILTSEQYYVFKPIYVTLEVGKKYIAANGKNAFVFAQKDDNTFLAVFDGGGNTVEYNTRGKSSVDENFDLIEEV